MTCEIYPVLRLMQPNDWKTVKAIYQEGIETGNATFQMSPPT